MRRRLTFLLILLGGAVALSGCGSDAPLPLGDDTGTVPSTSSTASADGTTSSGSSGSTEFDATEEQRTGDVDPKAMLLSVVQLLRTAATNPGGDNFNIAKDYLNQYFSAAKPSEFALTDASRTYLTKKLGPKSAKAIRDLETPTFTFRDSRHIEDCLLLSSVARHVAGDGEDLERTQRLFDWMVQQIQLVPIGSLSPPGIPQAAARPYDVLLRAMSVEEGAWTERSWLFVSLCRQLGIDAGLVRYTPPATAPSKDKPTSTAAAPQPIVWAVAVLLEPAPNQKKQAYLFDCRLGMPIPGPGGKGIATLDQAFSDPSVLARLDLPDVPYPVHQADLARDGKVTIWLDSTLGCLSPRMRQLQRDLAGRNRMIVYRDPSEVDAQFATVLGDRLAGTELWPLPIEVETRLFTDPTFNDATKFSLRFFDSALPLLPARLAQLRGDLKPAVQSYAAFRFAENLLLNDGKTPVLPAIQQVLDFYATYYLGLAKFEQGDMERAAAFFHQTIDQIEQFETEAKKVAKGQPLDIYFSQYRWGALTNLGRIADALGDHAGATRYYSVIQPTGQGTGNRLRVRELYWSTPFETSP